MPLSRVKIDIFVTRSQRFFWLVSPARFHCTFISNRISNQHRTLRNLLLSHFKTNTNCGWRVQNSFILRAGPPSKPCHDQILWLIILAAKVRCRNPPTTVLHLTLGWRQELRVKSKGRCGGRVKKCRKNYKYNFPLPLRKLQKRTVGVEVREL